MLIGSTLLVIGFLCMLVLIVSQANAYPAANDTQWKAHALRWHKTEVTQDSRYQKMRVALGMKRTKKLTKIAWHTVTVDGVKTMSWRQYGAACKKRAVHLRDYSVPRLHRRLTHPGGSGGARWKPLALYVGWTRAEWPTVLFIMAQRGGTGESGGNPRAINPRPPYCRGLMQLARGWYSGAWAIHGKHKAFDPLDPEANLRAAEGIHDEQGWYPWRVY